MRKPFFIVINVNVNGNQHTARRNQLFLMTFLQSLTHFKSLSLKPGRLAKKLIKCYSSVPNCCWSNCKFGENPPPILGNLDNFLPGAFYSNPLQLGTEE